MTVVRAMAPWRLASWSVFAAMLAAAGLPIYINAPKFYVDSYSVGLAAMGAVLFALRLIDVVQDPVLGWLAERGRRTRGRQVTAATAVMAAAMAMLFAVRPVGPPLLWFAVSLILLFSAFSFLSICFYAEGVGKAGRLGRNGYLRLAGWREAGSLAGVCAAAVAPTVLAGLTGNPMAAFALAFALLCVVALLGMRGEWGWDSGLANLSWKVVLGDPWARRFLVLGFVNGAPVAVTSTLFLFFVESRLKLPGAEGPLLLLFFLSAAISAPFWGRAAALWGAKRVLLSGMVLSVAAFIGALSLGEGDLIPFAIICLASGAALGADMVLLPAIFARRLEDNFGGEALGFGLWSFASKLSAAFAAAVLLPTLQWGGFTSGGPNPPEALTLLSLLYAGLPCALKLVAIALLVATPVPET
jgi:GPH family glycoside/pentoside/hexuronide:cation symporter